MRRTRFRYCDTNVATASFGALTLNAIPRTKHEENLAILRARRGDSPGGAPAPAE